MEILIMEAKRYYLEFMLSLLLKYGNIITILDFEACINNIISRYEIKNYLDLVILDLDIPNMSAIRILKKIRLIEDQLGLKNTKIILFSEDDSISRSMNLFNTDVNIFLQKTHSEEIFLEYLKKYNCI